MTCPFARLTIPSSLLLEKTEKVSQQKKQISPLRFVHAFCFSIISCSSANMRERATFLQSTCFNPLLHNFLFQCEIHLRTRDTTNICINFTDNRKCYIVSSNATLVSYLLSMERKTKILNFVYKAFIIAY